MPHPPAPVARAPNARSGLTDEVVPGAAPFVKAAGKPSRRLSKAQGNSQSHLRHKSRRSSASAGSVKERPSTSGGTWIEPDEWAVQRKPSLETKSGGVGKVSVEISAGRAL